MVWLFGGAVVNLGSKENYEKFYVPIHVGLHAMVHAMHALGMTFSFNLQSFKFTGMFGMSERGHGTNVRGIETTAHFDKSSKVRETMGGYNFNTNSL